MTNEHGTNVTASEEIKRIISGFLQDKNILYECEDNTFLFRLESNGEADYYICVLRVLDDAFAADFYLRPAPFFSGQEKKKDAALLACQLNASLLNGGFGLDEDKEEVYFRTFVNCDGGLVPTNEVILNSIFYPTLMLDKYGAYFALISLGKDGRYVVGQNREGTASFLVDIDPPHLTDDETVEQSNTEELEQLRTAAAQGDSNAQYDLGEKYYYGEGVEQNLEEAVKWYRPAAGRGHVGAQVSLGWMYENGQGVEQDDKRAARWYMAAAKQGNAVAQRNLGVLYKNGQGVEQDDEEAVKWFRASAEQGYASAQVHLGWMYENGRGIEQDGAKAVRWYTAAAEQGNAVAQYNLGILYKNGQYVEQNDEEAVKWFRASAEQGDPDAQDQLDWMRENGRA